MAQAVHMLRSQGIQVHSYLNDWIIRAEDPEITSQHAQETIELLQTLRWTINWQKSLLNPSQTVEFLGLHFKIGLPEYNILTLLLYFCKVP